MVNDCAQHRELNKDTQPTGLYSKVLGMSMDDQSASLQILTGLQGQNSIVG